MPTGIYPKTKEHRAKLSAANKGKHPTEETRAKLSVALKKLWQDVEYQARMSMAKKGEKNPFYGKHHTKETIQRDRVAHIGKHVRTEIKKGEHRSPVTEFTSERVKAQWQAPGFRAMRSTATKQLWQNPEHAQKVFRNASPNKAELKLEDILNRYFPGQWKFVGNKGVKLGELYPDFLNVNGKKQVIELFGAHWHDVFDIAKKRDSYRKYGFDVAIVWEDELKDEERLIKVFKKKFS